MTTTNSEKLRYKRKARPRGSRLKLLHSRGGVMPNLGGSFFLMEGVHGLTFAFKSLKHGQQLSDLQKIANALGEISQLDVSTGGASRGIERDQSSQAAAIDVADSAQVNDDVRLAVSDQALYGVTQCGRLVAKDDATIAGEDRDPILFAGCQFQVVHRD